MYKDSGMEGIAEAAAKTLTECPVVKFGHFLVVKAISTIISDHQLYGEAPSDFYELPLHDVLGDSPKSAIERISSLEDIQKLFIQAEVEIYFDGAVVVKTRWSNF